jgi:integrase
LRSQKPVDHRQGNEADLEQAFPAAVSPMYLEEISDREIAKIVEGMSHAASAANHAFTAVRTFFRWATKSPRRYIPYSPRSGMSLPFAPVKRKRVLTDRELFAVWRAAEARPDDYGIIVRLLILTGQRRGEIASLHSAYIDGDCVTLPEELAKDGHEHTYPLGKLAQSMMPRRAGLLDFIECQCSGSSRGLTTRAL